jgi:ATP-dependent helicase/nuclease subunit A
VTSAEISWTLEQRAGIETTGVSLLVCAAAGSGKTAVLSERCAYLICDADPPCDVDQLLVVTFTEAAAAQMKARIAAALHRRLEQRPDDARLAAQIVQLDRAQVSTLHAFCARLLRQHFHLVGLDPGFTILDADEARLLQAEVLRELLAERYEREDGGNFAKFIDVYGDGRDDAIGEHVLRTHELLCSMPDPRAWLAEALRRIEEAADEAEPLGVTSLGSELAQIVGAKLSALSQRCAEAIDAIAAMKGFEKYVTYLQSVAGEIEHWQRAFGDERFDDLAARVRDFKPQTLPLIRNDVSGKGAARAAIDRVRDAMGDEGPVQPFLRFSEQEWRTGLKSIVPFARVFLDLVESFRARYAAAKERTRRVDFADLESLTLKLLDGPSAVARALHRQVAHVLVDEYQDINGVQDSILRLVSRDCLRTPSPAGTRGRAQESNLFCVGDIKQSIYGFRLAEPARFLARYEHLKAHRQEGEVIDLQANFRSRAPLLEAINALFERLMTRGAADLDYDESQRLKPAATFPALDVPRAFSGAPIELHLLPRDMAGTEEATAADLDRTEREASFIAARIHELLGHDGAPATSVIDRDPEGQPIARTIEYRDIVILLRSMVYKAEQVAEVLRLHGIPVHRDSGSGYFDTTEARDVLALLHVLDNFQQDLPLAAVLRSPLAGPSFREDALARIRIAYGGAQPPIPFHQAVTRYAAEHNDELAAKLREFLARIDRWRQAARMRPLADLLWQIYDQTGYLAFAGGLDNGPQRIANLTYLHERARQFGVFSRQGPHRFLRFLESLESESDVGLPAVLGEGENVVRIMSVHKSKGLEFPVVFLPDLGKRFNLSAAEGRLLIDRARYLGLVAVDEGKQVRYPSLAWVLAAERIGQQAMAEELRVLYVAMTRAKEHLVLVGTCKPDQPHEWQALWRNHSGPLPADAVIGANTMLDWIGPAAAAIAGSGRPAFEVTMHTAEEVKDRILDDLGATPALSPRQAALAALKPLDPPPPASPVTDELIRRLAWRYPFEAMAGLPAAIAATDHATRASRSTLMPANLPLPKCVQAESRMTTADRGAAIHRVLQHLDFTSRPCLGEDLRDQIDRMVARNLLTSAEAQVIDQQAIEWFFQTDLGMLLRHTPREEILREVPFTLAVEPPAASPHPLDRIMLRGRIDLLVRHEGEFLVIDYKTDELGSGDPSVHEPQMRAYRDAVKAITGLSVKAVYLVLLSQRAILTR